MALKNDFENKLKSFYDTIAQLQDSYNYDSYRMNKRDYYESVEQIHEELDDLFSRLAVKNSYIIKLKEFRRQFNYLSSNMDGRSSPSVGYYNLANLVSDYNKFIIEVLETSESRPNKLFSNIESFETGKINKKRGSKKIRTAIFIIHGHDETNKLRLKSLLQEEFSLQVVLLNLRAGKGRTLIEKFEQEAEKTSYAFALFTPDDLKQVGESEVFEARPNVIFELGWFYGKMGRDKVTIIYKDGTTIPSDLDGISYIKFNESVEEKVLEIKRELQEAGLIESVKKEE